MAVQYDEQGNVISGVVTASDNQNIANTSVPADGSQNATADSVQGNGFENPPNINGNANNNTVSSTVTDMQNTSNSTNTVDNTASDTLPEVVVTAKRDGVQPIVPNPLHNFVNYTYGISLHLLDSATYNHLTNSPGDYTPNNVLIASAGRYDDGFSWVYDQSAFPRNPAFKEDFYFDELKMTTVIGITNRSRNSNAVEINFTIIEPNGFTLVNRLLEACQGVTTNYLTQPYLLQIDFYGYNDDGTPYKNLGQTKRIPIMLVGMKSRVTTRGTEYRIQAAPYNHKAFSNTLGTAPANFQIKANSLSTFFGKGSNSATATSGGREDTTPTLDRIGSDIQKLTQQEVTDLLNKVAMDTGYTNALNDWSTYLRVSNNKVTEDTYSVVFAPEILAQQNIVDKKRNPSTTVADKDPKNKNSAPDYSQQYFSINAGTSIEAVIDMVMRRSDYITKQITDPSTDAPENIATKLGKSLSWFKIVPKIQLGKWDPLANDYSKHITYYVKTWTVNNKHPNGPIGSAKGAVKEYNYIYTGKNSDVLDMSIDFDMLYFTQITVDRNKQQDTVNQARKDPNDKEASVSIVPTPNVVNPQRMVFVAQDVQNTGQLGGTSSPNKQTVGDVNKSLTKSASGDMINVKLRIIGDPTFIKQDDIFVQQSEKSSDSILVNNSIAMDDGELYVVVKFNTPIDYDERYGLVTSFDQDSGQQKYGYNMFSGRYAVITVDNVFSKGKFEQNLDLVRLHNQPEYDNLSGTAYPVGGTTWFRTPDFGQVQFPALQGFSRNGLSAGSVLTSVLSGGTGMISGIASAAINTGVNYAVNAISNEVKGLVSDGVNAVKDWWSAPSISWENIGTGGFENLAGGGASEGLINMGGIEGLSDWGTVNTGQLIDSEVFSMSSGLGAADLGDSGLGSLADGVDLGGLF